MGKRLTTKGSEFGEEFLDFVNNFSADEDGFIKAITNGHRTLQQSAFRMMLGCIKEWAKYAETGNSDLRNEDTVRISKKIMDALGEDTFIRYI